MNDDARFQPALDALLRNDAGAMAAALDADPDLVRVRWNDNTVLEWCTQPPHGISPDVIALLIERGSPLDRALNLAACFDQSGLVAQLLEAGADPTARADANITPLESAAYHGSTAAADVLLPHGLHRPSLWLAAASGDHDGVRSRLTGSGPADHVFGETRPDWASVGRDPGVAPNADTQEILDEALTFAAANGRIDALEVLLAAGADIDGRPYRNTTGLHLAIQFAKVEMVRHLVRIGADTSIQDDTHGGDAAGWAHACADDSPDRQAILDLLPRPRSLRGQTPT